MRRYGLVLGFLLIVAPSLSAAAAQMLLPNSPDPFCPPIDGHTEIAFQLPAAGRTRLEVRDVFDQVVRHLVDEVLAAGYHQVWWDGQSDAGETLRTGNFTIFLKFEGQIEADDCTIFCGNDLEGPYRQQAAGIDLAVAFAVGLEQSQAASLVFFAGDHTTVVRTIACGMLPAGASTLVWDLRDEGGTVVPRGTYWCRLDAPGYFEEIEFPLVCGFEPVTVTWSARDARGVVWDGDSDSLAATPIETPMREAWVRFNRPLESIEVQAMLETFEGSSSLALIEPDTVLVAPDMTFLHFPFFEPSSGRTWPDIWGLGCVSVPLPWFRNENNFMRLRHEFAGITMTDPTCALIGNVDPLDWDCPPGAIGLLPACPNPVPIPGTLTVRFELPASDRVDLVIVNRGGFLVRTLVHGNLPPGTHAVLWDLRDETGTPVGEDIYRVIGVTGGDVACGGDVVVGEVTAVAEPPSPAGGATGAPREPRVLLADLTVSPNPFHAGGTTLITWTAPLSAATPVAIFDLAGRCVRLLAAEGVAESGPARAVWDGRDAGGRILPGGVYLARPAGTEPGCGTAVVLMR